MAYICGSSIYVSLHVSGVYTTIHIRQHLDGMEETTGKTQINRDGLILTTDEFASLLYQLNAIEKSFKREEQNNSALQENVCSPTLLASSKRKADSKNNNNEDQTTTGPQCKVSKVDDAIKKWYVSKVKSTIQKKLQDDCFSCLMELPDNHICETHVNDASHNYLEKFFETVLNEIDSNVVITDLHLSASKSRSITSLVKRSSWHHEVKCDIQNDTD